MAVASITMDIMNLPALVLKIPILTMMEVLVFNSMIVVSITQAMIYAKVLFANSTHIARILNTLILWKNYKCGHFWFYKYYYLDDVVK